MPATRKRITATIITITLFTACDTPETITQPQNQPQFSHNYEGDEHKKGDAFEFQPLASSAACRAPTADTNYKPFDLAEGFEQKIILTELRDFAPVAGTGADLPDMNTLNETGRHAGRYLYRTHEVGSNGAVTVTDLWTGRTTLAAQQQHYEALDGIVWTPWQTVLFAEERIVASFKDPAVPAAVGGLVYEYDPETGHTVPRPAVGARSHEGLRFDTHGNLYGISESTPGVNGSGAIYKFVPDRRADLSSGRLYALKVRDASRTGEAVWLPLDRAAVQINSDAEAIRVGATGWGRPEDIEITNGSDRAGNQVMYVAITSEDLVLRIELDGQRAYVSNYIRNVAGFEDPDNLELDQFGNLFIAEDRSAGDIWMAEAGHHRSRTPESLARFASLSDCAAEPTGIYFDRTGKTLFVNVQHAGPPTRNDLTITIQRTR